MTQPFQPKSVTANDLLSGDVIYLTSNQTWASDLTDAAVFTDEASANSALAFGEGQPNTVVGVYMIDVKVGDEDAPAATHFRETFRATGPSNYFHGKQSQASHV
jgi:hypothetical protein